MKRIAFVVLVVLIIVAAFLTAKNRTNLDRRNELAPKLVVGIVVDQMRFDFLYRYWDQYSEGGFKRLVNEGFSCENHHYSYVPTKTGPGHASIYSGTTPSVHGVIANDWWVKTEKRMTNCVEDTSVSSVGTNDKEYRNSPKNLLVTNLSDEIKLNTSYKGKVIGISQKNRGAILPAGQLADAAYWFTGKEGGKFITSSYYMDELPTWVNAFNESDLISSFLAEGWYPLYDTATYWQSNPDDSPYETGIWGTNSPHVFPYDLNAFVREGNDVTIIKETPYIDVLINRFAMKTIEQDSLGIDDYCDVLTISYSGPDNIGHEFGPRSMEIQDAYLRLDLQLAELLTYLDEKVGPNNYTLFLTSDHGAAYVQQELIDDGSNIGYVQRPALESFIKKEVADKYGINGLIENISNQQLFIDEELAIENDLEIEDIEEFIASKLITYDGIYKTQTATSLREGTFNDQRLAIQKGYNEKLSGNVIYLIYPGWKRYDKHTGTTHGTSYAYDTQVPLLFYGMGIPHGRTTRRTVVEDIAPTITSLLHINYPMAATGNPVWEIK